MDLYEFEGKALLARLGVPTPPGEFCKDLEAAIQAGERIGYPCVVKSQVLTGGRGKAGGIAIVESPDELAREAARIAALEIKGQSPVGLLLEGQAPAGRELYAAVAFDTGTAGLVLLFSPHGGVEVEEGAAELVRIPVPVEHIPTVTSAWVAERLNAALEGRVAGTLPAGMIESVARLLANLLRAAVEFDLELLEINPLIAGLETLIAADAKVTVDDDALYRRSEGLFLAARPLPSPLEQRALAASLNFVDLDGEICLMANGAGLNLSLLDAVAAFGSTPANFLDTGGGASATKAYEGMRILQDRSAGDPTVRARLVMLSLAITRAREAAEGIARAVTERPEDPVPTFAVVHGTGAEEGVSILQEAGIRVAPDIRTAVEWAATAERRT
ncbi:MAG: ATP-grasp domain-containing protein [Thermoleophilia bacterium]